MKQYLAAIAVLVVLVGLYFTTDYLRREYAQPTSNTNTSVQPANTNSNTSQANLNTYTNSKYKFSFQYPKTLKTGREDFTYVPSGTGQRVALETQLIHEIDTEYCALSGECRPTTQDFGVGVAVIPSSLANIAKSIEQPLLAQKIGNYTFSTVTQGVEGEGINYYFVALNGNTTLMFDQRFIDENTLIGYKNAEGFITFSKQNELMRSILSTLTITK